MQIEMKQNYNIFLIGFMGVGKSTIASTLQKKLGMERAEMDQMIVEAQGMPISEIFEKYGENYFRDVESKTLIDLQEKENILVSCGGGVVVRPENAEYMKKSGFVVWLTATPETVYERVKHSTDRPILNGNMNVDYIRGLMEKRENLYAAAADIIVATDGKNAETICEEIIVKLQELSAAK